MSDMFEGFTRLTGIIEKKNFDISDEELAALISDSVSRKKPKMFSLYISQVRKFLNVLKNVYEYLPNSCLYMTIPAKTALNFTHDCLGCFVIFDYVNDKYLMITSNSLKEEDYNICRSFSKGATDKRVNKQFIENYIINFWEPCEKILSEI